ncbi:hypothetical protein GMAR_ORF168 [Golden Marseillevirus]|uniref:hypothetical protein n=1 Tax=Golden Marseillevirus TaxID=1720526 RepID=UPI000877AE2E|nr:hypothetical protein GMAR_ORF168 [Golden Marseillevirus]ALX27542.1 hypothetical protein GMAR_ORF168 [Golden Marseillevirus]
MTDSRLLTIVLIVAVIAIVFFVFGGCRVECKGETMREGLDLRTDVNAYFYSGAQDNPMNYKYGMTRKHVPLEMAGWGAYQTPVSFMGLPEDVGPQQCGPCS